MIKIRQALQNGWAAQIHQSPPFEKNTPGPGPGAGGKQGSYILNLEM